MCYCGFVEVCTKKHKERKENMERKKVKKKRSSKVRRRMKNKVCV